MSELPDWGELRYRQALLKRAERLHVDRRVQVRFDLDDLVQQTLLRATEANNGENPFRGATEGERFEYLFRIQARLFIDLCRAHLDAQERSVLREQKLRAIGEALTESLDGLVLIPADQKTPSQEAVQNEQEAWLDEALEQLPEREREAMIRRYRCHESLAEIAQTMGMTVFAAGSLITRATQRLREMRPHPSSGG